MTLKVIGICQLGNWHLQGMTRLKDEKLIYVIDLYQSPLATAIARVSEIGGVACVHFRTNISNLPAELDVANLTMDSDLGTVHCGK
jgi:hypothetical protein